MSENKLFTELAIKQYDFDPGATTATEIAWVDLRDFCSFAASFFRTIGTGATTFKIQASSASNGAAPVDIVTHAVGSEPDAVGDQIFLECGINDLLNAGTDLRYVSAVVSVATGTDEGVILYVRGKAKFKTSDLTADVVA